MNNRKIWEVDFDVVGPISIITEMNFRQEKGFDQHQFYSDIKLRKSSYGIRATITAYADNLDVAETVAYVYFGRMRDVLSLENDIPIILNKHEGLNSNQRSFVSRRLLHKSDIITASEKGVKNKIYQCFFDYFGDVEDWDLEDKWIDEMYDRRNGIVHGGEDTTIEAINAISDLIPLLEKTSKKIINKIIDAHYERREFLHLDF
jgi:hypothetical protein